MNTILCKSKCLALVLIYLLFTEACLVYAKSPKEVFQVRNVRFAATKDTIVIYYDLIGDPAQKYKIRLSLKNEEFISFNYQPLNISGDVGNRVSSGENKKIIWDIDKEFPGGLEGERYYFVVDAEYVSSGISAWFLIAGTVVWAGGVALLFLNKKTGTKPAGVSELPDPIGRPNR